MKKLVIIVFALGMLVNLNAQDKSSQKEITNSIELDNELAYEAKAAELSLAPRPDCVCEPPAITPWKFKNLIDARTGETRYVRLSIGGGSYVMKRCPKKGHCTEPCKYKLNIEEYVTEINGVAITMPGQMEWDSRCVGVPDEIVPPHWIPFMTAK